MQINWPRVTKGCNAGSIFVLRTYSQKELKLLLQDSLSYFCFIQILLNDINSTNR